MTLPTDPRTREREALEAALGAINGVGANCVIRDPLTEAKKMDASILEARGAILAYGRAVREADKEAASGVQPQQTCSFDKYDAAWAAGNWAGHKEAVAAIEALEEKL